MLDYQRVPHFQDTSTSVFAQFDLRGVQHPGVRAPVVFVSKSSLLAVLGIVVLGTLSWVQQGVVQHVQVWVWVVQSHNTIFLGDMNIHLPAIFAFDRLTQSHLGEHVSAFSRCGWTSHRLDTSDGPNGMTYFYSCLGWKSIGYPATSSNVAWFSS